MNTHFPSLPLILTVNLHLVHYYSRYGGEPVGFGFSPPGAQYSQDVAFPKLLLCTAELSAGPFYSVFTFEVDGLEGWRTA